MVQRKKAGSGRGQTHDAEADIAIGILGRGGLAGGSAQVPGPGEKGAALEEAQDAGLERAAGAQRLVAVLAPFGDVAGQVVEAVAIGGKAAHRRGEQKSVLGGAVVAQVGPKDPAGPGGRGPPGVGLTHQAAPGRGLPLVFGGQLMGDAGDPGQPPAEGRGVVPGDPHHRLIGAIEIFILPVEGRLMPGGLQKPAVLGVGDLGDADIKRLQAYPMRPRLIGIAAGLIHRRAQPIRAPGDEPEADGLDLQGLLSQGGPAGQQQPAQQKEQDLRFSSVRCAVTISRQFFKTLHMDHL